MAAILGKFKKRHGYDWPVEMSDVLVDLTIAKKWRILRDERGVEFKDPWERFLEAARALLPPQYFSVSPWTEEHFHDFVMYKEVITWGCASSSKAQPLDAVVYTPSGPAAMGGLRVGDRVLGADGLPASVIKTHDVGMQDEYSVSFSDGTSCICAGSHLWKVYPRLGERYGRVVSTEWMSAEPGISRYHVPFCSPVEFEREGDWIIDPYVMGVLLGDGSFGGASGNSVLRFTNADSDIVAEVSGRLRDGYHLRKISEARGIDYCIVGGDAKHKPRNEYIGCLRSLGLWGKLSCDKFIPEVYLYASAKDRLDLLSGLLDTDGCVCKSGSVTFSSTAEKLSQGVVWLARSLGGTARMSKLKAGYRGRNGERVECLPVYHVTITIASAPALFRCKRKSERASFGRRGTSGRRILCVRKTGRSVPMKCITVSNSDGLYLTNDFIVTHNSNDYGLMLLLDFLVDPLATVTIIGSTTKIDLRMRIWESVVRYHEALKGNTRGFEIPCHVSEVGFLLSNEKVDGSAESAGKKAAIRGVALNEDGRLQGAHLTYVRVLVDELATISNFDALDKGVANLSVAKDFRFYGLANPKSWDDKSCRYCLPKDGQKVTVDTGSWMSGRGIFVRHHDGLKSAAYLDPSLERTYPFLMNRKHVGDNLRRVDGNWDAPLMWEQVRGFPLSSGSTVPTVLDPQVAAANKISGPPPPPFSGIRRQLGMAAGVDPAWSEGGDDAIYAGCRVFEQDGRPFLDFSGLVRKIPIKATSEVPITQQQRDFVIRTIREDGGPDIRNLAVDDSGNQGLGDSLITYVGSGLLSVNNSRQASQNPVKATDGRQAREIIKDRGTESWCVLAEFAKAGQLYGLPQGAVDALVQRRFAMRSGTTDVVIPLRLEAKDAFKSRFGGSPNEADACALAALAVSERLGIIPFGTVPAPDQRAVLGVPEYAGPAAVTNADTGVEGDYGSMFSSDDYG